jgi:imidazolonepropionase-like amidohydrolase
MVVFEGFGEVLDRQVRLSDVEWYCGDRDVIETWDDLEVLPEEEWPEPWRLEWFYNEGKQNVFYNLKKIHEAGITVAAGTDAGNIGTLHGPSLHRELELMAEAGLESMDILVSATLNGARVFSKNPEFGTIEAGKLADMVILNADPLQDISNIHKIELVIKNGWVFKHEDLTSSP